MPFSFISSLSHWGRDQALQTLLKVRAQTGAPHPEIIVLDALENRESDSNLWFRLTRQTQTQRQDHRVKVEGRCISCATKALVEAHLKLDRPGKELLVVLPTAVSLSAVLGFSESHGIAIKNAVLALDCTTVEDDLWDSAQLSERGLSSDCEDERTAGEFIIGEIDRADTVITSQIPLTHPTEEERERAQELISHLGPHLRIISDQANQPVCGCFDQQETQQRSRARHLPASQPALRSGKNFSTVVVATDSPLDHELFNRALPRMVEGACRVRGTVWLDNYDGEQLALEGIGPAVWLESLEEGESASTAIAITGDNLDPQEIQELLDSCTITGDRLVAELTEAKKK